MFGEYRTFVGAEATDLQKCLEDLRWRAGLASRAAREVDADNQNLDGHDAMVAA